MAVGCGLGLDRMRNIFKIVASEAGSTARNFPRREVGETFSGLAVLQLPAWIYENKNLYISRM